MAAGCGGVDVSLFNSPLCNSAGSLAVEGLTPAVAVDYIDLRELSDLSSPPMARVLSQTGTSCKTASNPATCQSALSTVPNASPQGFRGGCSDFCWRNVLATTRGDTVSVINSPAALTAFLAPIDSEQDAAFVALTAGQDIRCTDKNRGAVRAVAGGYEVVTHTDNTCGGDGVTQYLLFVDAAGNIRETSRHTLKPGNPNCVIGRRPVGLRPAMGLKGERGVLGQHFARSARLEEASVHAFQRLRHELEQHGAPRRLLHRIEVAARDEVRHTRQTTALAHRYGSRAQHPSIRRPTARSLGWIARENAVEGCVRETYGALVGLWQSTHAHDAQIAQHMRRISEDEIRHAELSWDIAAWLLPRLSPRQQRHIARAQLAAVTQLWRELLAAPHPTLVHAAGLPDRRAALQLLQQLADRLWPQPATTPAV
jgi:hypothetical protein